MSLNRTIENFECQNKNVLKFTGQNEPGMIICRAKDKFNALVLPLPHVILENCCQVNI